MLNLGPGALISAEPTIKNNKLSIEKYEVKEQGTPVSPSNGQNGMTPELWAEKDRFERRSRESIACFQGIIDLAKTPPTEWKLNKISMEERFAEVYDAALDWAEAHFVLPAKATKPPEVKAEQTTATPDRAELVSGGFKDLGEFLTRVSKELGYNRADICERLSINDVKEITDYPKAWATLTQKPLEEKES